MFIEDIIDDIGVTQCTIYRWIRKGKLKARKVKYNNHDVYQINLDDYLAFLTVAHRYIKYSNIYNKTILQNNLKV